MRHLVAVAILGLVACGDSSNPVTELPGTYYLQSVNGNPLPAVLVESATACRYAVITSVIVIENDQTFSAYTGYGCFPDGTVRSEHSEAGVASLSGNTLTLDAAFGADRTLLFLGDGRLTQANSGNTWVYRR